jgi:anthranilate phosphoribosyltransferase
MNIDESLKKLLNLENLSFSEAESAMKEIMTGKVSHIKLASWLTALRMKGESPEEIAGCASVMRECSESIKCEDPKAVDIVGTGGDGANTINVSTAAAFVAAGAGVTVAKHGNRAVSSKSGSADVLGELGVNINISPKRMEECLNSQGIAFLFAPLLHPAMKHAMPVRKELGVRTVFNVLGPLTNPAKTKRYVLGVYDEVLCMSLARAAVNLDFDHSMIVHGSDGLDELTVTGPTHVCELKDKEIMEYKISPEQLGFNLSKLEKLKGGTSTENAEIIREILSGKHSGPKKDIIILNAAAAIYVADKADCWEYAIERAEESIESGLALKKLKALVNFTNK